jgi:PKHD-type hydroxylase
MRLLAAAKDKTKTEFTQSNNFFTQEELHQIQNIIDKIEFQKATTQNINSDVRDSKIKWLYENSETRFLFQKLGMLAVTVNDQFYDFKLTDLAEAVQYTVYEPNMHYTWHVDSGVESLLPRKLSITIKLSNPDEYEGGDLQIWTGGEPKNAPREQNCAVCFPSFRLHRVTPVTKGIRKSLVIWVGGPSFK